jgi:DnaK suppressor protein
MGFDANEPMTTTHLPMAGTRKGAQAATARRQDVKKPLKTSSKTAVKKISPASNSKAKGAAPAKKAAKPAPAKAAPPKAVTKGKPVVKKAATKVAPKPATKPMAKPLAKSSSKLAPKAVVKASPKVAPKAAAKPVAKTPSKGLVKPVVKTSAKAVVKPVAKPATKPVAKAPVKPVAKPTKAPVKVVAKTPPGTKVAAKVATKESPKAAPKSASKAEAKPVVKKLVNEAVKPVAKSAKEEKNKSKTPVAAPVAETPVVAADVPARAVRPSARLAQITVPSMAQSVASTAAKASYLQNMPTQVLTPPPFVAVKKDPKLANNWKTKKPDQLTDAEVMAMSDNDYMNDAQMAFFRLKLVQLKQGILANAGETTEHLREDTVVVPDPADRATIEEEHALELRTRDRERKLLKKIEQSIQRIDAGDYGYCDETGEPIGVGRLLARPTANLSLEAQQRRELKQKMFGD